MEDLESYRSVMPQIVGQKNRCHPAASQLALDTVAVRQGCLEAIDGIGQVGSAARGDAQGYKVVIPPTSLSKRLQRLPARSSWLGDPWQDGLGAVAAPWR
jgi:hypothetical protein